MRIQKILVPVMSFLLCLASLSTCKSPTGLAKASAAGPNVTDADGNVYTSVVLGVQTWTVENLRVTKLNDGTAIPNVTNAASWSALTTPGYCYNNNTANADSIKKYGAIYNWHAVTSGKLAPAGWRVPTEADWAQLQDYLINTGNNWDGTMAGNKLAKSMAATTDWILSTDSGAIGNDLSKNNKTGLTAFPAGYRDYSGKFGGLGRDCFWWTATKDGTSFAIYRNLRNDMSSFNGRTGEVFVTGFSVRLIKN
jgi:uncharacterized protein (TIGR02145 family)